MFGSLFMAGNAGVDHRARVYGRSPAEQSLHLGPVDASPIESFTIATPQEETVHRSSGWKLEVLLDREGRPEQGVGGTWRSGEAIKGAIHLQPLTHGICPSKSIASIIVRAYWQSVTLYSQAQLVEVAPVTGRFAKLKPVSGMARTVEEVVRPEWHRGYCDGGEGVELWNDGGLENVLEEVTSSFPLLQGEESGTSQASATSGMTLNARNDLSRSETVLPFAFLLPTTTRVSVSNSSTKPPSTRRELQSFRRTPPCSRSSADSPSGSIEWVIEVIVRLEDSRTNPHGGRDTNSDQAPPSSSVGGEGSRQEEPPAFGSGNDDEQINPLFSQHGLLHSTSSMIVQRVVFPFEPHDYHIQDLYSCWRPQLTTSWSAAVAAFNGLTLEEVEDPRPLDGDKVLGFGRDARDEALGGSHMGPKRPIVGKLVDEEGGRAKWTSFEKRVPVRNNFGRLMGFIRAETSIGSPPLVARHSQSLRVLLHLSYPPNRDLESKSNAGKIRPVYIERVQYLLVRRTMTRGGKEERPHFALEELQRQEIKFRDVDYSPLEPSLSLDQGRNPKFEKEGYLRLESGRHGIDLRLDLHLQQEGIMPNGKKLVPLRDCCLSTRTPNIECEYVLSLTLHPVNASSFFILRTPIQVIAGDLDETPNFESLRLPELPILTLDHTSLLPTPASEAPSDNLPEYYR